MAAQASLGELTVGIVDHPARTLDNVAAYPRWRWVFPVILAVVALAVYLAVAAPLLAAQAQLAVQQQLARMPASQAEAVQKNMAVFGSPAFVAGTGFVTGLIALLVGWLLGAGIIYFEDLIGGGELVFPQVLAIVPWLHVPIALEQLLQAAWVATQHRLIVNNGLAYLVSTGRPAEDARNLAYVALGQLTLFRAWHLVLVYALFRGLGRLGRWLSFWMTVAYFVLLLGGTLALTAVGKLLAPGG
jgi:hypothetical protein